jgi:hypothetical protein
MLLCSFVKNCFRSLPSRLLWPNLPTSLAKSVLRYEARLILRALELIGGVIRQAARLLELTHQGRQKILNNRHKDLQSEIAAIKAQKRGTSLSEGVSGGVDQDDDSEVKIVTILRLDTNLIFRSSGRVYSRRYSDKDLELVCTMGQ